MSRSEWYIESDLAPTPECMWGSDLSFCARIVCVCVCVCVCGLYVCVCERASERIGRSRQKVFVVLCVFVRSFVCDCARTRTDREEDRTGRECVCVCMCI